MTADAGADAVGAGQGSDAADDPLRWVAPVQLAAGPVTVVAAAHDAVLARTVLALASDARLPWLPPMARPYRIAIAPSPERFRAWLGSAVPEWGAAVAYPGLRLIVMQGSRAGSGAGDPVATLRHELAHLALHEALGFSPPRWFDEGYASVAAGEGRRSEVLATSATLVWHALPPLDELDEWFLGGGAQAQAAYALAHLAVEELASLDPARGLTILLQEWRAGRRLDRAVRLAYGVTLAEAEARWVRRVRWRYGLLSLAADAGLVVGMLALLLVPLWVSRRRRDLARLEAMRAAEARQEAEAAAGALAAMLGAGAGPLSAAPPAETPEAPPGMAVEGRPAVPPGAGEPRPPH